MTAHDLRQLITLILMGALSWCVSAKVPVAIMVSTVNPVIVTDQVEALGTLRASETVDLTVNVAETVDKIHFQSGQRVKQGQVLVELSVREEKALLQEARYTMDEALSQLNRIRAVAERGDASQALLDEKSREYFVARARLEAIRIRLQDRIINAPFDGVVGLRNVSTGTYLAPGDVITTLIDDRKMKLDFSVPSLLLSSLHPGVSIVAYSKPFPEREFSGTVEVVDNRVDPISRSVVVRAILPNDDGALKPGLLMEVELMTREREALLVPEAAIVQQSRDHFVFLLRASDEGQIAEKRKVQIGSRWRGAVEIVAGLHAGDVVITDGTLKVENGDPVKVLAPDSFPGMN